MKKILLAFTSALLFSCVTGPKGVSENHLESSLDRPLLSKSVTEVNSLVWTVINEAQGYDIQISLSPDFSDVEREWTIHDHNSLTIPEDIKSISYVRVRSFNNDSISPWSVVYILDRTEA